MRSTMPGLVQKTTWPLMVGRNRLCESKNTKARQAGWMKNVHHHHTLPCYCCCGCCNGWMLLCALLSSVKLYPLVDITSRRLFLFWDFWDLGFRTWIDRQTPPLLLLYIRYHVYQNVYRISFVQQICHVDFICSLSPLQQALIHMHSINSPLHYQQYHVYQNVYRISFAQRICHVDFICSSSPLQQALIHMHSINSPLHYQQYHAYQNVCIISFAQWICHVNFICSLNSLQQALSPHALHQFIRSTLLSHQVHMKKLSTPQYQCYIATCQVHSICVLHKYTQTALNKIYIDYPMLEMYSFTGPKFLHQRADSQFS
jgi:hypothetical protein